MPKYKNWLTYGPAFRQALVDEQEITLSPACASLAGRTLLFMSDVHVSPMFPEAALDRLMAQVAALKPDMLLLGGDYAEQAAGQALFFARLGALRLPLGAYAVLGNNDRECFPRDPSPLLRMMREANVTPLIDDCARPSGVPIVIAGLDEMKYRRAAKPLAHPLFRAGDERCLRILLAHYPHVALRYLRHGGLLPQLCLSGHTHGGQLRIGNLTPYSLGFERRCLDEGTLPTICGWAPVGESRLLVSPGIGTSRIPIRMGIPPHIHRIKLRL